MDFTRAIAVLSPPHPQSPLSPETGSGRISVSAGALTIFLPILSWQYFPLQQETSYKADNIFSPNAEIS